MPPPTVSCRIPSNPAMAGMCWKCSTAVHRDMGEEARRNMAVQILHQRRFEEELQKWLKEIRDEAFVEVRLPGA